MNMDSIDAFCKIITESKEKNKYWIQTFLNANHLMAKDFQYLKIMDHLKIYSEKHLTDQLREFDLNWKERAYI